MITEHPTVTDSELRRYEELQQQALDFARSGETTVLATMIDAGLAVNLQDAKGNSLLMLASYHQNLDTVLLLIEKGADPDTRNDRGQTPLGGVAFKGYPAIASALIDAGANIDADNGSGMTPLMYAKMFGRTDVATLLEDRGADTEIKNRYGISARACGMLAYPISKTVSFFQR